MIYVVEDDKSIRELVVYTLCSSGREAQGFETPAEFRSAMAQRQYAETAEIPVMMITAKGSEFDKVVGLDSGADDYLPKPFGMMELIARVRALLRRTKREPAGDGELRIGSLSVSPQRHTVTVAGEEVALTYKEFEMLVLLLRNRDRVLTREQFLDQVWGYAFDGENRTVDVHIRTLRQKLGEAEKYIRTVRGIGYKLEDPDEN